MHTALCKGVASFNFYLQAVTECLGKWDTTCRSFFFILCSFLEKIYYAGTKRQLWKGGGRGMGGGRAEGDTTYYERKNDKNENREILVLGRRDPCWLVSVTALASVKS